MRTNITLVHARKSVTCMNTTPSVIERDIRPEHGRRAFGTRPVGRILALPTAGRSQVVFVRVLSAEVCQDVLPAEVRCPVMLAGVGLHTIDELVDVVCGDEGAAGAARHADAHGVLLRPVAAGAAAGSSMGVGRAGKHPLH